MIKTKQDHDRTAKQHNDHPSVYHGLFLQSYPGKILHHITRQINQTTRGYDLRQIVKRTLPTDIFGLILRRELFHINAIRCHVMRSPAKRYNT